MNEIPNRSEHPARKMGDHTTPTHVFGKEPAYKPASQVYGQPANDIYGEKYSHGGSHQGDDLTAHGKNMDKIYASQEVYKDEPAKKVGKVRGMINKLRNKK